MARHSSQTQTYRRSLPSPKKCITKVLHGLLTRKTISEQEFHINSFRSILSDLRNDYGINIRYVDTEKVNEFGKIIVYRRHFLLTPSKNKAIKTYLKINEA